MGTYDTTLRERNPRTTSVLVAGDVALPEASLIRAGARAGYLLQFASDVKSVIDYVAANVVDITVIGAGFSLNDRVTISDAVVAKNAGAVVVHVTTSDATAPRPRGFLAGKVFSAPKPSTVEDLMDTINEGALYRNTLAALEAVQLRDAVRNIYFLPQSERTKNLVAGAEAAADTDPVIVIVGEPGTGKESLARYIHAESRDAERPFVPFHCGLFGPPDLEDELFGCAPGATPMGEKRGAIWLAAGGTLFLEAVPKASQEVQLRIAHLLRTKKFRRRGDDADTEAACRVILAFENAPPGVAGLHPELAAALPPTNLSIPPLRERKEDILPLAKYYIDLFKQELNKQVTTVALEAEETLLQYKWPGNVRELRNVIERGVILSKGRLLQPAALTISPQGEPTSPDIGKLTPVPDMSLAEAEKRHILAILSKVYGNRSQAARILGVSRTTLWSKLKQYGVS